jgi:hypothetical protein
MVGTFTLHGSDAALLLLSAGILAAAAGGAVQHLLHDDHHVAPARLDLLFLPLWYVLPNLALTAGLLGLALRNGGQVASRVLGAMFALLYYEWVHLIAHLPYVPKTAAGRWMKRYHLRHHFVNERLWFGVSNP